MKAMTATVPIAHQRSRCSMEAPLPRIWSLRPRKDGLSITRQTSKRSSAVGAVS